MENLLESWGVKLERDVVFDKASTLTGRELFLQRYGKHKITERLRNLVTIFYGPRSVEPDTGHDASGEVQADKSRVFVLATTSEKGWSERNLKQNPAEYTAGVDRPGPISVAVAVENMLPVVHWLPGMVRNVLEGFRVI